ncbi:MAG: DUF4190 domain-containing protein [Cryomorphaceae bacterium]
MKSFIKAFLFSFLLSTAFTSCKTSSGLSDSKVFQKRKYTKGYHVDFRKTRPKSELKSVTASAFEELNRCKEIEPVSQKEIKPIAVSIEERTLVTASTVERSEKTSDKHVNTGGAKWVKNITLPVLVNEIFSKPPEGEVEKPMPATAVLSFLFAIVGIFVAGIPLGLLAILMGVLAISKINKNPGMKGQGLAIAGIVIGAVAIIGALYVISTM